MADVLDLYGRVSKLVRDVTDAELRRHGLRLGQDHLLAQMWREDGRTPGELAAAIGVTTPAVTKGATVLANAGLLERRRDPHDQRLVRLWLTPAGRRLRRPVERSRAEVERTLLAGLTAREVAAFRATLEHVQRTATGALGAVAQER
jgi:DNA-binding MarR family transcriptional regulator